MMPPPRLSLDATLFGPAAPRTLGRGLVGPDWPEGGGALELCSGGRACPGGRASATSDVTVGGRRGGPPVVLATRDSCGPGHLPAARAPRPSPYSPVAAVRGQIELQQLALRV
ncbi:unnamed protein product [Rangifer tarandus platyrhynchus]|uniref:Uncharacterized protein n=2 Tax=Rangifer tarandus platyrhynchus TaxID=3082113 RepID=A0ABN8ZF97_RANTA|nr:unnamed protein product [Rangifer tarandus platyrhynchus]